MLQRVEMTVELVGHWLTDGRFGERLRLARTHAGYTQEDLSELCGGKPTARRIRAYENEGQLPQKGGDLRKLAEVLGVTPGWLLLGEESLNGR